MDVDADANPRAAPAAGPPPPAVAARRRLPAVAGLLTACHLGATLAVVALVTAMAAAGGQDTAGCARVAAAVLAGQLSVGWSNDAVDAARDAAAGRRGKPVVAGVVGVAAVRLAAVTALALCVPLSLACGLLAGTVHLAGVAAGWAYNLRLKATAMSWLPYAVGFAALPAFVSLGLPGRAWPPWWIAVAAALLGVGAHLADVLPDIGDDLATGVRGWPQRLGPVRARLLLPVPLVAATALLVFARPGAVGAAGATVSALVTALAAGGALLGRRWPGLPFLSAVLVAAVDVALLLGRGAALA
ncbi:UbiA family prenyltransferase [Streptomyces albidochromogenes]|uniref:UbiA family prenyltransferase n=1 Tax=Streptomyces albidochromogenes TaxID=329524 RepID=A0ABW6FK48_9ACTN